jgi:putative phosphoribosyl transferase
MAKTEEVKQVRAGRDRLEGLLGVPESAAGLVIFAHGSGSGRLSPRNNRVAAGLREAGLATLLVDLLKPDEERDRANVFDIELLSHLRIGYFGASTGAAAALVAAAHDKDIAAVISRGGRPDLAGRALPDVAAPTLLIVGGADLPVIALNRAAFEQLRGDKEIVIVPGASHLFEEPGTMEQVLDHAKRWFLRYLQVSDPPGPNEDAVFRRRQDAGRRLAAALMRLKGDNPVVLVLPRGGVPVGFEVAKALDTPFDVVLSARSARPSSRSWALAPSWTGAIRSSC